MSDPKPRFEDILKIDVHAHIFDATPEMAEQMRANNIRVINICFGGTDPELLQNQEQAAERLFQDHGELFPFASTFDLTQLDMPDYAEQCITWLERSFSAGAVMTKVWKDVGMKLTRSNGEYVMPDGPVFDPIYAHLAKRGKPLMIHCGDIRDVWEPLATDHIFYTYFRDNPEWHMCGKEGVPSYSELIASRDRLVETHPDLTVIGAHLGSMSRDLPGLARRLDSYPNLYVDCSARTMILSREPADVVRDFFLRYHDRILYGTDFMTLPGEEPADNELVQYVTWTVDNYRAEYMYYAGSNTVEYWGEEVECLDLPGYVLENLFFRNALRIMPF